MAVNFSGVWNANLQKSRFLGPSPRAVSVKIVQSDPELKARVTVTRDDGSEDHVVVYCRVNGEPDTYLLNGKPIRGSAQWAGDELILESWVQLESWLKLESRVQLGARELHLRDCWSLSGDRQTLMMEHRDDDLAGQVAILERTD
jgi:hypothetical protein